MVAVVSISATACPYLRSGAGSSATRTLASREVQEAMLPDFRRVLEPLPSILRPQALLLTGDPFSVEGGELTTNFKLRRGHIARKYQAAIAALTPEISAAGQTPSETFRLHLEAV
jgi:long-subunit acyl-CoA synthetase (AMP-forming)